MRPKEDEHCFEPSMAHERKLCRLLTLSLHQEHFREKGWPPT